MTVTLPRLDRVAATELVALHRSQPLEAISAALPDTNSVVTYSVVGGARIDFDELSVLRRDVVALALECGMPRAAPRERIQHFEGQGARLLHSRLPMTPHEASQDDVWSYITCCWL